MATAEIISSDWENGNAQPDDYHLVSDERLLAAAESGETCAFGELYKRHTHKIFRTAHRITRNREDAEDAVR